MSALASALRQAMTQSRHDLAVLDKESGEWIRRPWPEVHGMAESIAARLLQGDHAGHVGLVGEPTIEFIAAIQGAWLAGAAVSILPSPVRGADLGDWAHATLNRFAGIDVTTVFSHGTLLQTLSDTESPLTVTNLAEVARRSNNDTISPPPDASVAILQGTAGSTGTPRTAALSPAAALNNIRGLGQRLRLDSSDVGCSWLPMYHDMGLAFVLTCSVMGMPLWVAPTSSFAVSPFRWINWLSHSRATTTAAPNMAYNVVGQYASRISDVDLSAVRVAINGGEPVDCAGFERFTTALAPFGFPSSAATPAYGLAESTCAVTMPEPGEGLRTEEFTSDGQTKRYALLGKPIPGMEMRVVPGANHPQDGTGEIEIRGNSMMSGYLGETPVDPDAWFPTGDIGYLVDGSVVVCGRAKEIITVAGRNIFPTEIEQVAAQVHGVRKGAVVAVGTGTQSTRAGLVIAAEFRGPDQDAARSAVIKQVASVCGIVPADVVFMSPGSLPRTSSGKLRRLEVRRQLEASNR